MSNSNLVEVVILSPNHSFGRTHAIDTITPHYMGGDCTVETCGEIFLPASRQASSNYGVGSDGRIGMYVHESDRAWTSGSGSNDNRAVTIECANMPDSSLTDACWDSLVALCVDICRRNGYVGLWYNGSVNYGSVPDGYMLLTMHCWFQDTSCPGPWLKSKFGELAREVTTLLDGGYEPHVEPRNNAQGGKLDVDGICGYNTVYDMQYFLGTYKDGVVSGQWRGNERFLPCLVSVEWGAQGSPMVRKMQNMVKTGEDGLWGHDTTQMLQIHLSGQGYDPGPIDGLLGYNTVKALQRCLNDRKFIRL